MGRLSVSIAALTALAAIALPATAAAHPLYEGALTFPDIADASGAEDYSWEVELSDDQALRAVDPDHAEVYYVDGDGVSGDEQVVLTITAPEARDAAGADVPTTLGVSEGNVLTLTVHHRAGDPLAEGAPFDYPVVQGPAWVVIGEGHIVPAPLLESVADTQRAIEWNSPAAQPPPMPAPPPRCRVLAAGVEAGAAERPLLHRPRRGAQERDRSSRQGRQAEPEGGDDPGERGRGQRRPSSLGLSASPGRPAAACR